jgi:DNA-packaging protein gp3
MAALKGNQFWKLRTSSGRGRVFSDPYTLWEEACLYFDWCDRTPLKKVELVKFQGDAIQHDIPLGRPYSMKGLTIYLGVTDGYFRAAKAHIKSKVEAGKADENDAALLETMELIEQVCHEQNVAGAAVGIFNANLVARIHGIADKVENHNTGDAVVRVTVRDQGTADNLSALDDLL